MNSTIELPAVPFQCLMGLEYSVTAATSIYQPGWKFIIFFYENQTEASLVIFRFDCEQCLVLFL